MGVRIRGLVSRNDTLFDEGTQQSNATQAAVRAGYSKKTAGQTAFNLLKKTEIQNAISTIRKILIVDFSSSSPPHHLYGGTDIRATVARYQNIYTLSGLVAQM